MVPLLLVKLDHRAGIHLTFATTKAALRKAARERRLQAFESGHSRAAGMLCEKFLSNIKISEDDIVAGYWPAASEIDCRPLLNRLAAQQVACCLPVVSRRDMPLSFYPWKPDDPLTAGEYGIMEPLAGQAPVIPTLVIVPLLAFDAEGWRLGYGGGYYDRTIETLKKSSSMPIRLVGVAFEAQQVDKIPCDVHDQQLDAVVTEEKIYNFR